MKVFGQDVSDVKAFGNDVVKIIAYGETVWEKQTSIPDYLCFEALESGTFTLTIPAAVTTSNLSYVEYSLDGRTWVKTNNVDSTQVTITTPTLAQGDKVYWRGNGVRMTEASNTTSGSSIFSSDDGNGNKMDFNVSGCVFTLLTGSTDTTGASSYTFCNLFNGSSVVDASGMFFATGDAFGRQCRAMFAYCSKLVSAPLLNNSKVGAYSYYQMFYGCSALRYVKCLATDISGSNGLVNWLYGVASNGTFIQASGVSWPTGTSGIPSTWLAVNDGSTFPNNATAYDYVTNPNKGKVVTTAMFMDNYYGYEIKYKFVQAELDEAFTNGTQYQILRALINDNTNVKSTTHMYYLRNSNPWLCAQRNAGIYTNPSTGVQSNNSTYIKLNSNFSNVSTPTIVKAINDSTNSRYQYFLDGTNVDNVVSTAYVKMNENPHPNGVAATFWFSMGNAAACGQLYYCKLYKPDGTLFAEFVPCKRNSDSVVGLWDKLNLKFVTSDNSNKPLVAGND